MRLRVIAEASQAVAATRSRNAKRDLLAEVIASAAPGEIEIVVRFVAGRLRQRRTGVGWASLTSLPAPSAESNLEVVEVDRAFEELSELAGAGSAVAREAAVHRLFARATADEQRLLVGLVSGELRQGALDALVQEGLAAAFGAPSAAVRRAAMLLGSTPRTARLLAEDGEEALAGVRLQLGVAVQPMLAASAPDVTAAVARSGLPAVVDDKLDGIRIQVHREGAAVRVYTRSLEEITDRLPEVVAAVRALPHDRLVLDGEALAFRGDGRPEVFQVIASRTASTTNLEQVQHATPLLPFFFDLLALDGEDLLDRPLRERVRLLAEALPEPLRVRRRMASTVDEVADAFRTAVAEGFEGVVVKNPETGYAAGRRDAGWIKVKPRHTFDLVVTAVEWGHGRRQGLLSNLHLAARGVDGGLVMLGKTFKGLTDEMLRWQTDRFLALEEHRTGGTVYVRPEQVVEIACDGLQISRRYRGGVALRFARVLRYRDDKGAEDADTLATVRELLPTVPEEA